MSSLEGLNNSTIQILCSVVCVCVCVRTILPLYIFSLFILYFFSATNILTGKKISEFLFRDIRYPRRYYICLYILCIYKWDFVIFSLPLRFYNEHFVCTAAYWNVLRKNCQHKFPTRPVYKYNDVIISRSEPTCIDIILYNKGTAFPFPGQ
jgi:hypothetical protein